MAGRLSFNLLQDDVEDNTDLTPAAPPVVATPEPPAPVPTTESHNVSFGERRNRGWREGSGDFSGRGRRGARGGRGRGGRGRGMRGRGNRGAFGGGGLASWDKRGNGERGNSEAPQRKSEDIPPQLKTEELVPVELKAENAEEETKNEGTSDAEKEDAPPQPPKEKEMTLDEYMAKKAAMQQEMRSLSTKSTRKANDGQVGYGGKMAVLKKKVDGNQEVDETSIMSSVQMKQIVDSRSMKDSTHAAVADNAKNQEFFKTSTRSGPRSYQGRDARMNGNGDFRRGGDRQNTGFKGGNRGGRYDGGENRNRGPSGSSFNRGNEDYRGNRDSYNKQRSGAPNVDDQSAFPSLNA